MKAFVVIGVIGISMAAAAQAPTSKSTATATAREVVVMPNPPPEATTAPAGMNAPAGVAATPVGNPAAAAKPGGPAAGGGAMPTSAPTLPAEFSILQTRNMFAKGGGKGAKAAGGPEAQFVLKGAVQGGGRFMAFLEEKGTKRVQQVNVGDSIARGKVKSITLDAIEYEAGGAAKRIEVGQDLNGQVAPPTPPPASKPSGGAQPPPGPGGVPGQAMPPGTAVKPGARRAAPPGQPQAAPE